MAAAAPLPLSHRAAANRLRRRASYASVSVALVLIAAKFGAWLGTGSVALLSSLIDSMLDALASLVTLFALRQAMAPADREHRFGHGKAEPLAVLGQSAFIAGSALWLLAEAVRRLILPAPIQNPPTGIAVMLFAIVVTLGLVSFQRHVVKKTGSLAVGADELHYRGDLILNLSVLAALVLESRLKLPIIDPLFGGAIGLWITYSAARLARVSLTQLMDRELSDEERARIRAIAQAHPEVVAAHDLKTRVAGPTAFIQLHIEMDGAMSLLRAHQISDEVEGNLREAYPNAEIIIHQDPEGIEEARASFPAKEPAKTRTAAR
ncbi:MAG TPA: cation diffusion facilitator family transporter [Stellaceae bacterium]|nr:cation diffusion facilitator family transporter [Stellaceae bacterium]